MTPLQQRAAAALRQAFERRFGPMIELLCRAPAAVQQVFLKQAGAGRVVIDNSSLDKRTVELARRVALLQVLAHHDVDATVPR